MDKTKNNKKRKKRINANTSSIASVFIILGSIGLFIDSIFASSNRNTNILNLQEALILILMVASISLIINGFALLRNIFYERDEKK